MAMEKIKSGTSLDKLIEWVMAQNEDPGEGFAKLMKLCSEA
jgi:hypothetical protein